MTPALHSIEQEATACRAAWKGVKVGALGWHIHHETLWERTSENIENRIAYILAHKPRDEQALRLRLMRPIADDEAVASAEKIYDEAVASAEKIYDEAVASAEKIYGEAVAPARKIYDEAVAPAEKIYGEAVAPARKIYDEAVASVHDRECIGCPWDGTTIFPAPKAKTPRPAR